MPVDHAVVADPHAAGDDAAAQRAVRADLGAAHDHGALDRRALADHDAVLEHGAPADAGALGDLAAGLDQRRRHDPALGLDAALDAQVPVPIRSATSVPTEPSRMSNVASR